MVVQTTDQTPVHKQKYDPHGKKNHSLLEICPLLRNIKGQEEDYWGYKSDYPSLGYSKMCHKKRDDVENV